MQATIKDIRRGDRFTWNGHQWIATDDSRPSDFRGTPGESLDVPVIAAKGLPKTEDGGLDIGASLVDHKTILATAPVDIDERDIIVHRATEELIEEPTVRVHLADIMDRRARAQREADDLDRSRDVMVRRSLELGVPVPELMQITGLSRARIYQIRDGRR